MSSSVRALVAAELWRLSSRRMLSYGLAGVCVGVLAISVVSGARLASHPAGRFVFWERVEPTTRGVVLVVAVAALLYGSTSVGADWASRSWRLLLAWEPRRIRLVGARYVAGAFGAVLGFLAILVTLTLGLIVLDLAVGVAAGEATSTWGTVFRTWLAGAYLVAWAGVVGMAFAHLTMSTTGGVVLGVGLCLGGEFWARAFAPWLMPWSVGTNAQALLGFDIRQPHTVRTGGGASRTSWEPLELGTLRPVLLLSTYLVLIVVASVVAFRVRDVP